MQKNWRKMLYEHYMTPPEKIFPRFKLGASIFLLGLVIMYGAHQLIEPSLTQELVTLLGLILIGGGLLLSLLTNIRMLIGRILRFFMK